MTLCPFTGDVWVSEYDSLHVMLTKYRCVYRWCVGVWVWPTSCDADQVQVCLQVMCGCLSMTHFMWCWPSTGVFTGDVWVSEYDPLHVMLRAVYRREIQQSMDRYTELYVCLCVHISKVIFVRELNVTVH